MDIRKKKKSLIVKKTFTSNDKTRNFKQWRHHTYNLIMSAI